MAKQIMIVDDDVDNLELMQLILECAGFDVQGCTTIKDLQRYLQILKNKRANQRDSHPHTISAFPFQTAQRSMSG